MIIREDIVAVIMRCMARSNSTRLTARDFRLQTVHAHSPFSIAEGVSLHGGKSALETRLRDRDKTIREACALRINRTEPRRKMILPTETHGAASVPLYQLKMTLKWSDPAIWRRVVVRADMPLSWLHYVIQEAMGWTNSHLHHFIAGSAIYGTPDPQNAGFGREILDERRHTVADLVPAAKKKFLYEYDFGDGWIHEVVAEKILPPDSGFKNPVCLAGENACPPEDCGGIPGYYNLLEILGDRKHPEYRDMKEWMGGKFDPAAFKLDAVNKAFKRLKA